MNSLTYTGNVTVSIVKNKTIIKTYHGHNSGSKELFHFFAYALAGKYKIAESLRPLRIMLFEKTTDKPEGQAVSNYIGINVPTTVEATTDNTSYKATLHFLIPYTYITGNKVDIYKLYPLNSADALAIFDAEAAGQAIDLSNINKAKYSLIVDWELLVSNTTTSTAVTTSAAAAAAEESD